LKRNLIIAGIWMLISSILFIFLGFKISQVSKNLYIEQDFLLANVGVPFEKGEHNRYPTNIEIDNVRIHNLPYNIVLNDEDMGKVMTYLSQIDILENWTTFKFANISGLLSYLQSLENHDASEDILWTLISNGLVETSRVCENSEFCEEQPDGPLWGELNPDKYLEWVDEYFLDRAEAYAKDGEKDLAIKTWKEGVRLINPVDTEYGSSRRSDNIIDKAIIVGAFLEQSPKPTNKSISNRLNALIKMSEGYDNIHPEDLPTLAKKYLYAINLSSSIKKCVFDSFVELEKIALESANSEVQSLADFVKFKKRLNASQTYASKDWETLLDADECTKPPNGWYTQEVIFSDMTKLLKKSPMRKGFKTDLIEMLNDLYADLD